MRRTNRFLVVLTILCAACKDAAGPAGVDSIRIEPRLVELSAIGETRTLSIVARDGDGNSVANVSATWASLDPSIATVNAGVVQAVANGETRIVASAQGRSDTVTVRVQQRAALIEVSPAAITINAIGHVRMLDVTARDANGVELDPAQIEWRSLDPAVAEVDASRVVTARDQGVARIRASAGTAADTALVTVRQVVASIQIPAVDTVYAGKMLQLSVSAADSNGVAIKEAAFTWFSDDVSVATVSADGLLSAHAPGETTITATLEGLSATTSIAVVEGFASLVAGNTFTCGLTSVDGNVYCWGNNGSGQHGTGDTDQSLSPRLGAGGAAFTAIAGTGHHVCGIATSGNTLCWGNGLYGQLGNAANNSSTVPVAVAGGLSFTRLAGGRFHTCGLTAAGVAYCWGLNLFGTLGNGSTTSRNVPVAVSGGLAFTAITGSEGTTCALTASDLAYCWGGSTYGELGMASPPEACGSVAEPIPCSTTPNLVDGGHHFMSIAAGPLYHACAITNAGAAFCWGENGNGKLGDGTMTSRSVPTAVVGGLAFARISAGGYHTCALTADGTAYCWGFGPTGQLGNGANDNSTMPVAVAGGMTFTHIAAGLTHKCAIATTGATYCSGSGILGFGGLGTSNVPRRVAHLPGKG